MKRLFLSITLSVMLGGLVAGVTSVHAETLTGQVLDQNSRPISGLIVYLVHPDPSVGRSIALVTDISGRFSFSSIPVPGNYYLQVYWGRTLVYQNIKYVSGYDTWPTVVLN